MVAPLVAITDVFFPTLEPTERVLADLGAELRVAAEPTPEAILEVGPEADGLLVTFAKITGDIIRELKRCRVISRAGVGVDNVDLDAANQAGIVVTYVPDYCVDEVSDHALAMLLALARKIHDANRQVHAGQWTLKPLVPVHRLQGRTLGLIAFGKIPRALAPKALAFGLQVVTYDPYITDEAPMSLGVKRMGFEELLRVSDYISVHVPLTSETHHMFNADTFRQMRPGAFLVNTARGPVVDIEALIEALNEGRLAGAALDVLPQEPPLPSSPLLERDDVILTPHAAFYSEESLVELQTKAAQNIASVLSGKPPRYPYTPQIWDR